MKRTGEVDPAIPRRQLRLIAAAMADQDAGESFGPDVVDSALADFIEHHAETIVEDAVKFAKSLNVGTTLDADALRDHLLQIVEAIVTDLRTPQSRAEEIEKSEGRAPAPAGRARSRSRLFR